MISEILLTGLDGGNPLAFLAALGTHRLLSLSWPSRNVRMSWVAEGTWLPCLQLGGGEAPEGEGEIIDALATQIKTMIDHPAFTLGDDLKVTPGSYRQYACSAAGGASLSDRVWADYAAAFGCEISDKEGFIQDTALRATSKAGNQPFLEMIRKHLNITDRDQLKEAVFGPWLYRDKRYGMRWDPADNRSYALQWKEPMKDPANTVRGANCLAIAGMPLMPCIPTGRTVSTTGFSGSSKTSMQWTWPIWTPFLEVDSLRSLLALRELQEHDPSRKTLPSLGIAEIYRSRRVIIAERFRSFTPAEPV